MQKILIAATILSLIYVDAMGKRPSASIAVRKKAAKDTVVWNFKVCKNDIGYTVCGQPVAEHNTTYPLPPHGPEYQPDYEKDRATPIVLRGIPAVPKVKFPYDQESPETQSGEWVGICSWNGLW